MGPTESKVRPFRRPSSPGTPWPQPTGAGRPVPGRKWEVPLNHWSLRLLVTAVVASAAAILIYRTWWLFLAAALTQGNPTDPAIGVPLYEQAIKYNPNNADYHYRLGQFYNYSTQFLNIPRAGEEYEAAVRLNPYKADHWRELSKYYEQQKNIERSRFAMTKALERDPNYAQTHWAAANLYIRLDDLKAADIELRRTADLDVAYLTQVLDLVWRFYEDPDRIMATHVPNTPVANLTALNYFVTQNSERGADLAWSRLKAFTTTRQERFNYVDFLANRGKADEAWSVFIFPDSDPPGRIFNPSFEMEPLNGGFDWRYAPSESAVARRDTTTAKTGIASWNISFDGKENPEYDGLLLWIPVKKGTSYKLSFWIKTEGISTNEGMYVEVAGAVSEKTIGTVYWQQLTIPFVATSDLVTVHLRRTPSRKLDSALKGKVWVDDFALN